MSEDLIYQLSLELTPDIGPRIARQLIAYSGSGKSAINSSKSKLLKIPGIGVKTVEIVKSNFNLSHGERVLNICDKEAIRIAHFSESEFPQRLIHINDAPNFLFYKGSIDFNPLRSIAIVGTRKATNYGKGVVEKVIEDLAPLNAVIISGLAYGIDIQAHRSALKHNCTTIGIIAGGIDRIYPSAHKNVAQEMMTDGGIVSESLPGTKPDPHLFPQRNRLIAGMTDATIVVEAAEKGGALITATLADSYNRAVFAIPGNLKNEYSKGTNKLIASQKAMIYTGIQDLITQLNWDLKVNDKTMHFPPKLSEDEKKIYELLRTQSPIEIDQIAIQTNISINETASNLLALEFKNLVKNLPGKKYELVN